MKNVALPTTFIFFFFNQLQDNTTWVVLAMRSEESLGVAYSRVQWNKIKNIRVRRKYSTGTVQRM